MTNYKFKQVDFDNPSFLFKFEDFLKNLLGESLFYGPYIKTFDLKGDEKVLDFGCGGGVSSRLFAKLLNKGGAVTCVDASKYWVNKACKRLQKYSNVECKCGDIRKLDILDSSFDIILIIHVIHDIAPKEREGTVLALGKKLKKGGKLYIWEPTKESHGMPAREIRELMENAGLREILCEEGKNVYKGVFEKR